MNFKAGFVGLIGQPNAGKSTLLNLLVREKLSIVTDKPQTTRQRIQGIVNLPKAQIVFVDSPGVIKSQKGLNRFLMNEALDVIEKSDVLLGILNIDEEKKENLIEVLDHLAKAKKPAVILLTKVDLVKFKRRIPILRELVKKYLPEALVFEFSSQWGSDSHLVLEQVNEKLSELLPSSEEPLFDADLFTTHQTRELVSEIIREKCFELFDKEIPYSIAIRIRSFEEAASKKGITKIHADILVSRASQQKIVVGTKGEMIKKIGTLARKEIEKLLDGKVFLGLQVVVRENWQDSIHSMKELGYDLESRQ